jgi:hypothetical protein
MSVLHTDAMNAVPTGVFSANTTPQDDAHPHMRQVSDLPNGRPACSSLGGEALGELLF